MLDPLAARSWWRYVVYGVGFLTLATGAALGELNGLLMATHLPGAGSYGIGSLSDFGLHLPDSHAAYTVVQTWCGGTSAKVTSVFAIAHWEIWTDCVFAFLYPALAGIWLLKTRARLERIRRTIPQGPRAFVDVYRHIATVALVAVPVVAFADLAENLFERRVVDVYDGCQGTYMSTGWFWALYAAALVKYLAGLVVFVGALATTLGVILLPPGTWRRIGRAFLAARGPVIIVALFALVLEFDPTGQAGDTIRRWEYHWPQAAWASVFAVLLGWLSGLESKRVLATQRTLVGPLSRRGRAALAALGVALCALGAAGHFLWRAGDGLLVPGVLALVVALASWFLPGVPRRPRPQATGLAAAVVPPLVAAVPPIALGVVVFRAGFGELAYSHHPRFAWLVALGVVLQLIGWGSYELIRRIGDDRAYFLPSLLAAGIASAVAGVVLLVGIVVNPWTMGENFGTVGLLTGFFLGVAALAYLLLEASEQWPAPQLLVALRIQRIPWFGLFLLWLVLAALIDSAGKYYDVRLLDRQPGPIPNLTPAAAYRDWQKADARGKATPLLFVSTSGGGIRAAYWTAIVLECVLEGKGPAACAADGKGANARAGRAFFAASGISGGSLGLATYAAHLVRPETDADWPERRLGNDYLAPTVGWALFVDLPFALIRRDGGTDRAEVLERGWERSWVDHKGQVSALASGLFERWRRRPFPLLLLNGTKVQDGCRFETSVLSESIKLPQKPDNNETLVEDCLSLRVFERSSGERYVRPAARAGWALASSEDLVDYLCRDQDVRLSTAALMSARFPYVLSSGRLVKCHDTTGLSAINLVDGGYFDTSGASPIVELWDRLRPLVDDQDRTSGTCVVPVFLQIDNSYANEPGPGRRSRPWESSVPLQALGGSRNAREANARQAAALEFANSSFGNVLGVSVPGDTVDRVAHIYPRAHPGSKAPLGWTLSRSSMADLRQQLDTPANAQEIEKVREWFSPRLTCRRAAARRVPARP